MTPQVDPQNGLNVADECGVAGRYPMRDETLFPETAIALLKQCKWNPNATMSYEGMSGGLFWSDEFPPEVLDACIRANNFAFRFVLGYRASLIRQSPRESLRAAWDQLIRECPAWPGLRPERCSPGLLAELESRESQFMADFDETGPESGG